MGFLEITANLWVVTPVVLFYRRMPMFRRNTFPPSIGIKCVGLGIIPYIPYTGALKKTGLLTIAFSFCDEKQCCGLEEVHFPVRRSLSRGSSCGYSVEGDSIMN